MTGGTGAWALRWEGRTLRAEGEVDGASAATFARRVATEAAGRAGATLDLDELDLLDGIAVVEAVNAVRAARAAWGRLELVGAPQMLAHTLFKVGALEDGALSLVDPRVEEGTTAN